MASQNTEKGEKRMRGIPVHYDELKRQHGIWLTDSSWLKLKNLAKQDRVSVGEYIERIVRSLSG